MTGRGRLLRPLLSFVALAAVVIVLPAFISDFRAQQLAYVAIYLIAILGLNVLTGYAGQISLGHGAFMAIGGYTTAILMADHGVKDERGHGNMGYLHVREFIEREGARGRGHVQQRIDNHFYPFHLAAFGGSSSANNRMWRKWGLKQHTNDALRAAYHAEMSLVLDSLGLKAPVFDDAYARGVEAAANVRKAARESTALA